MWRRHLSHLRDNLEPQKMVKKDLCLAFFIAFNVLIAIINKGNKIH